MSCMYNQKKKIQTVAVKENNQVMGFIAGSHPKAHPKAHPYMESHSGNSDGQRYKRE